VKLPLILVKDGVNDKLVGELAGADVVLELVTNEISSIEHGGCTPPDASFDHINTRRREVPA
jgi:hypothetical protein